MAGSNLYISHNSALYFWRTNPPFYVLEGEDRNIRALRHCPSSDAQIREFVLSEAEFGERPIDVLVPEGAPRPRSILRYHIQKAQVPPHSLYPLRDGIHVVSPEFCFVQLCRSLSFGEAALLGMELCGTYALRPEALEGAASRDYQLMSATSLCRKVKAWRDIRGLLQARIVAKYLADRSASPMETFDQMTMCLPYRLGGYSLTHPLMNSPVHLSSNAARIAGRGTCVADMLWMAAMLDVEHHGKHDHSTEERALSDRARVNGLKEMGYEVIELTAAQVNDLETYELIVLRIAKLIGKRIRPDQLGATKARLALRRTLRHWNESHGSIL